MTFRISSLGAAAILFGSFLAAGVGISTPRLAIDQAVWDFGSVTNQQELTYDHVIRNDGETSLTIGRVVSSCELCLSAWLDRKLIPPGATSVLHCKLDLRKLSGAISRSVSLFEGGEGKPCFVLGIVGTVIPLYEVTPTEISLDLASAQSAVAQIMPLRQLHAPLTQVLLDDTNMIANISSNGLDRFVLTLQASPSLPSGQTRFNVTILSADSNDPPCRFKGKVSNPPNLEVIPPALQFEPQAQAQRRMLWIRQRGPNPMVLLDVIGPSENLRSAIDADPSGFNYRVEITAWEQSTARGHNDRLLLKMRDQLNREHLIPVPITVDPAKQ